jgi:hypothetical protein
MYSPKIILTVDYEIWGNGTGSFTDLVYKPTNLMLDVCERYGAKLTIFAEMGHYWAMKRHLGIFDEEIALFEKQLKRAIKSGHDVQLHLHPQWTDAEYKNNKWILNFDKWACSELDYQEIYGLLKRGKAELENILVPINKQYKCIVFRAGGWCALPSTNLVEALIANGFLIDSSVAKGRILKSDVCDINYTNAFSEYIPWKVDSRNINYNDPDGKLMEFPIFSSKKLLPLKYIDRKIKQLAQNVNGVKRDRGIGPVFEKPSKDLKSILQRKIKGDYYQNDFCTITSKILLRNLKAIDSHGCEILPLVFIGHSKNFVDSMNFDDFIKRCSNLSNNDFSTFYDSYCLIKKNDDR